MADSNRHCRAHATATRKRAMVTSSASEMRARSTTPCTLSPHFASIAIVARSIHVVGIAFFADGRCLVAQRWVRTSCPRCWAFPGGKVEPEEEPAAALRREMAEELGIVVAVGPWLGQGRANAGDTVIVLDVYAGAII